MNGIGAFIKEPSQSSVAPSAIQYTGRHLSSGRGSLPHHAGTPISNSQPPKLRNKFVDYAPPNLWCFPVQLENTKTLDKLKSLSLIRLQSNSESNYELSNYASFWEE